MKVILLKDVRGVGQHGEVKDVRDGYAVNCLFPHKWAEPATEEKLKAAEAQAAARAAEVAKAEEQLTNKIKSLHGKELKISARATEKGGLFKSVSAADVAKAIRAEHSLEIPESVIEIPPIKTLGEHGVVLNSKNTKAALKVTVSAA